MIVPDMSGWTPEQVKAWAEARIKAHVAVYGSVDTWECERCGQRHHWAVKCKPLDNPVTER